MPQIGEKFGSNEDFENLRVHGENLYWHGKKIRVGGWSVANWLTLVAIIIAFLVGLPSLVEFVTKKSEICGQSQDTFCKTLNSDRLPLVPEPPALQKEPPQETEPSQSFSQPPIRPE